LGAPDIVQIHLITWNAAYWNTGAEVSSSRVMTTITISSSVLSALFLSLFGYSSFFPAEKFSHDQVNNENGEQEWSHNVNDGPEYAEIACVNVSC
jgi:hypothetical protein